MLKAGDRFEHRFTINQEEVNQFAEVTGDTNPIHLDSDYASKTPFKKTIIHGIFSTAVFSKILGTHFPGEGSIYLGQEVQFKRPMFPGEEYTAVVTLEEVNSVKHIGTFKTEIFNSAGKQTVGGMATVKHDEKI